MVLLSVRWLRFTVRAASRTVAPGADGSGRLHKQFVEMEKGTRLMEFIDSWKTFDHPHLVTIVTVIIAVVVTAVLALPVIRVARKTRRFKPQSALLLLVPALLVTGGVVTDDVREQNYRHEMASSGAVDASWAEIESAVKSKYNVSSVESFNDPVDALNQVQANSQNVANAQLPLVTVHFADADHTEVYFLRVSTKGNGFEVDLEQQPMERLLHEGVDPDRLLLNEGTDDKSADL